LPPLYTLSLHDALPILATLGLAVVIENVLLYAFGADTRTLNLDYAFNVVDLGIAFLAVPRVIGFGVVLVVALVLWLILSLTDTRSEEHTSELQSPDHLV